MSNLVINFHTVSNAKLLNAALLLLKARYTLIDTLTLKDYLSGKIRLRNSCHITVDDGDISFYRFFFPLLIKHNIPASIFVSPEKVCKHTNFWFQDLPYCNEIELKRIIAHRKYFGDLDIEPFYLKQAILKALPIAEIMSVIDEYFAITHTSKSSERLNLDEKELLEINNSGLIEIGAHTINHPILANENDSVMSKEITDSIVQLEKLLGKKITTFAYPNGIPEYDFSHREMDKLSNVGIEMAFSTENELLSQSCNKYAIPRTGLWRAFGGKFFHHFMINRKIKQSKILKQREMLRYNDVNKASSKIYEKNAD
jgi:peptidoglycan/xylan/chitin deacetylase (PgdA/CDA1 family)